MFTHKTKYSFKVTLYKNNEAEIICFRKEGDCYGNTQDFAYRGFEVTHERAMKFMRMAIRKNYLVR